MIEVLIASIIVTLIFVEIVYRAIQHPKLKPAVVSVQTGLSQFRSATTDDERQALLLSVGSRTLLLSVGFLIACVALLIVACAPLWIFAWDEATQMNYFIALTILSILWFFGRVKLAKRPAAS